MKFNKIIYIRYNPLTEKIYKDFYFKEVQNLGIQVEYWDLSSLFFKKIADIEDSSYLAKTIKFYSYKDLILKLESEKSIEKILFISIMSFDEKIIKLYKILTNYNCILSVFGRNVLPYGTNPKNDLIDYLRKLNFKRAANFVKIKLLKRYLKNGLIKNYDYIFIAGNYGWRGIGRIDLSNIKTSATIKVNSDDYDTCMSLSKNSNSENRYILFLDEYLPFHPDTVLLGIKTIKPNDYYPYLNKYFDFLEKKFKLEVVIAAHPKALKYHKENYFNGRKVFFNKTAEVTKDALFVLAHDSTSINYPIYFNKKIHFITSNKMKEDISIVHWNTLNFAKYLGCNYQYFDDYNDEINLIHELPINKYHQFKLDFHTSIETENSKSVDLFINFLQS